MTGGGGEETVCSLSLSLSLPACGETKEHERLHNISTMHVVKEKRKALKEHIMFDRCTFEGRGREGRVYGPEILGVVVKETKEHRTDPFPCVNSNTSNNHSSPLVRGCLSKP